MLATRIVELEREIENLTRRMPAHSVHPSTIQRLEDLEDELEEARQKVQAPADA